MHFPKWHAHVCAYVCVCASLCRKCSKPTKNVLEREGERAREKEGKGCIAMATFHLYLLCLKISLLTFLVTIT